MRKIAIVGPESTGKTVLTEQLANAFNEPWVREYARTYLEEIQPPYQLSDLIAIAEGQLSEEQRAEQAAERFLFCDTNLLVIRIWAKDKFGHIPIEIEEKWVPEDYFLHLLLYPDLDWEPDPLREDADRRIELFHQYESELEAAGVSYAIIKGVGEQRLKRALWTLDI